MNLPPVELTADEVNVLAHLYTEGTTHHQDLAQYGPVAVAELVRLGYITPAGPLLDPNYGMSLTDHGRHLYQSRLEQSRPA